jgi:hypothetical protein
MMRVTLSTPVVLDRINRRTRPFSFLFCVLVDPAGYPAGLHRDQCTLIAPFSKHREQWMQLPCVNVQDGREYRLAIQQTPRLDRVVPQTFGAILRLYLLHPESKSLAPDGSPCSMHMRGLLRRASIVAGAHRHVGKETDRRWQHGEDLSLLQFQGCGVSTCRYEGCRGCNPTSAGRCVRSPRDDSEDGIKPAHDREDPPPCPCSSGDLQRVLATMSR